jgi:serine---pyruvate transaminase
MDEFLLLTAGPTPISAQVKKILNQPITFHRSREFIKTFLNLTENLKYLFQTKNDVLILTASGTGAMEAAISNFFSPGDSILVVENGKFSERWSSIAKSYKLNVNKLIIPWGKSVTVEQITQKLQRLPSLKGVFLNQCETSTGALTKLETIAPVIRKNSSALIVVDAISSMAVLPFKMDEWGIDVAVTGSQKGLGLPPGLSMVAVSSKAWDFAKKAELPRFYLDLGRARQALSSGAGAAYTPSIPLVLAADFVLREIKRNGLEKIWQKRLEIAENFRQKIINLGLDIFPENPANSLTVFKIDHLSSCNQLPLILKERFKITVSKGQAQLANKVVRVGHMVNVNETDLSRFLESFQAIIKS